MQEKETLFKQGDLFCFVLHVGVWPACMSVCHMLVAPEVAKRGRWMVVSDYVGAGKLTRVLWETHECS